MTTPLTIDIVSDVICPWCFVGKRRLEAALRQLGDRHSATVVWHPFQLNPSMPPEGIPRRDYRSHKFGSWERSQALDARLVEIGQTVGIDFHFERQDWTPNTVNAHRLIHLAQQEGMQDAVVEALFLAYFVEGRNVGDRAELVAIATGAGLSGDRVRAMLDTDEGMEAVYQAETKARRAGVDSVPHFVFQNSYIMAGAQPPEVMARALEQAAEKRVQGAQ